LHFSDDFRQLGWGSSIITDFNYDWGKLVSLGISPIFHVSADRKNGNIGSFDLREIIGTVFGSISTYFSGIGSFFSRTPQVNIAENKTSSKNSHDDSCECGEINSTKDISNSTAGHNTPQNRVLIPLFFLFATMGIGSIACSYFMQGFIMQDKVKEKRNITLKYIWAGIWFVIAIFVGLLGFCIPLTVFPWHWGC
jgi:hypothetical protein